jgi:hypothetical protein
MSRPVLRPLISLDVVVLACEKRSLIGLAVPGPPLRSWSEDRTAEGVRDRRGPEPAGTRWVHADPAGSGVQRAQAVTTGAKEPQVGPPP